MPHGLQSTVAVTFLRCSRLLRGSFHVCRSGAVLAPLPFIVYGRTFTLLLDHSLFLPRHRTVYVLAFTARLRGFYRVLTACVRFRLRLVAGSVVACYARTPARCVLRCV